MAYKKWIVKENNKEAAKRLAEECNADAFIALLASARGYNDPAEFEQFLSNEPLFSSPFELPDMEVAVEIIHTAIKNKIKIAVFGDYDCDGITSTALLCSYFKKIGVNCASYIPSRLDEGYGMSNAAIDTLAKQGVGLIITVDNGIKCIDEIEYANSLNITTVVTDHHLPGETLPNAAAVVNPHRKDSAVEFKEISGVFVAYKLVCALEDATVEQLAAEYADLVSIGLVADVMPLVNENRDIVKIGLKVLNNTKRMGLVALLNSAGIGKGSITAGRISFGLAPRINAAGRMGNAQTALDLLMCEDFHKANELAVELERLNTLRQQTEKEIFEQAVEIIEQTKEQYNRVIVVSGKNWHKGVVGIVAARITEKYGKPSVVLTLEDDVASGSGRSIEGFSLYSAIAGAENCLIKYGGHDLAAGVTLYEKNINEFRAVLNKYASSFEPVYPVLNLDCKLNPAGISLDLAESLELLEPCGVGNPSPVFGMFNMRLENISKLGESGNHLKLNLSKNGSAVQAIIFKTTLASFPFSVGDELDVAVTVNVNEYNGRKAPAIIVKSVRPSGVFNDDFFKEYSLYESFNRNESETYPQLTREDVAAVYRGVNGKNEECTKIIHYKYLGYFKTAAAFDVLKQLNLIRIDETVQKSNSVKAELTNSDIFNRLAGDNDGSGI